ncbi:alcohol oxidase [Armillaria solidipes]|uniref:Alcohol oxidase n=1 Tax=Armillaria solidipes TaxID=1076256 RepID=A0A2H3BY23_9AGAR|nr:alcohol oxidase [Armillaria solidipes]
MLGGCSAINAEMAQYGVPGDYDKWAIITGDDSWTWNNFKHYFTKFETYTKSADYPNVKMSNKGTKGPVRVGYFPAVTKHGKAFIDACKSLGIPFSADFNSGESPTGVNRLMTYVDDKLERVTSETAYLTPEVLARPNLKVAIHAQVTKILVRKTGEEKRAYAVEFTHNRDGPVYYARARKEVILSAGAIHSPQILMLSGIGPSEELRKFNIPVVHELQGVGAHLMDHPVIDCNLKDKTNTSPKYLKPTTLLDLIEYVSATIQYLVWRRGPAATNLGEAAAFVRTDDASVFPDSSEPLEDSTSSPSSPDIEIFTMALGYQEHGMKTFTKHTVSLHSVLLQPLSIGSIRLKSLSPFDGPVIDPRYLESEADVKKLVRGFKLCLKISETEPLAALLDQNCEDAELDHHQRTKNDAEIEEMIRSRVETLYHPTSTCRMAPLKEGGVVDVSFCVYGIQGLRVCDASIFPSIISGHTAGATFAVAEKLSDIMKRNSSESPS